MKKKTRKGKWETKYKKKGEITEKNNGKNNEKKLKNNRKNNGIKGNNGKISERK